MSNRMIKGRSCDGKRPYPSWEDANSACMWHYRTYRTFKEPYECRFCKKWHVGKKLHQPKKRRK